MKDTDKEIIKEDLYFIMEYVSELVETTPAIIMSESKKGIIRKIERRVSDIATRVES